MRLSLRRRVLPEGSASTWLFEARGFLAPPGMTINIAFSATSYGFFFLKRSPIAFTASAGLYFPCVFGPAGAVVPSTPHLDPSRLSPSPPLAGKHFRHLC